MKITKLSAENFRNLGRVTLSPCAGVNVIYGDNAQGKTNLVEGVWLLTGARSFRGCKDSELIPIGSTGEARTYIEAAYWAGERDQSVRLDIFPKKQASHNEIALSSPGRLAGKLYVVVFSPTHLSLVKDGPQERRDFIDTTICQLKPQYSRVLADYGRVLHQRNALLKDIPGNSYLQDTLEVWDSHLVRLTATIVRTRATYLRRLGTLAAGVYHGISEGRESLTLEYQSRAAENPDSENLHQEIAAAIQASRQEDIRTGVTNVGAHRDDILIAINRNSARSYGSQGQQRSVVLALKLAECGMIQAVAGEEPVVLLDDVMSELDAGRRSYLLNAMTGRQIFITCCDPSLFAGIQSGKSFHIEGGRLTAEEEIAPAEETPEK